ncbi:hypothetical protein [Tsukamurella sp. TY48]|uniref:hypothetical protein n=1 Tax=Tsukamurella TaxID=2060 RepID=UPI001C7D11F0|nr:hypothetical protein [Tsukamurella sp. TY48]
MRTAAMQYRRAGELARRLFEFTREDFFDLLLSNLLRRDLEGAAFESDVIHMLMALPSVIELRKESGVKGDDYDIDLWFGRHAPWPIEVKTRAEDVKYSEKAFLKTLDRARQQLPEGGVGSVFMKLPESWVDSAIFQSERDQVLARFFGATTRVHAVVLVWEVYVFGDPPSVAWQYEKGWSIHRSPSVDAGFDELLGSYERIWAQPIQIAAPRAPF